MKPLVKKITKFGLLKLEIIVGTLLMAASVIGLPVAIMVTDITLMSYPIVWGILAIGMLFFASVAFLCFIRPYLLYRKAPAIQVETDGEFLYIHTKKEAKIPLADLSDITVHVWLPYLYQKEFLDEIVLHLFSEKYGDILLNVPGYGTYRMRFVSQVKDTADELVNFICDAVNNA